MPVNLDAKLQTTLGRFTLDIAFHAPPGITVIWGPSGSGKSLTLDCLAGFMRPTAGRILLGDALLFDAETRVHRRPQERHCGYIFQDHALFPHMTVRRNLEFAASVASFRAPLLARRRRIAELLETFDLAELADRRAQTLSGGQKQRAALARTLVANPQLLLLDEPSRGLDPVLRDSFYQLLESVAERAQIPILLVTHDLDECFRLARFILLLSAGRILQSGEAKAVLSRPSSLAAAQSLGLFNLLPATVLALDPGRNTSKLQVMGAEIAGPYLPGHLLGDHGHLCVSIHQTLVTPPAESAERNQLVLPVLSSHPVPQGTRVVLEGNIATVVPTSSWILWRSPSRLAVSFQDSAVQFLS